VSERDCVPLPDGVRRSPTGRVPQWVLDEALGRPVERVPFRGASSGFLDGPHRPRSRGKGASRLIVAVVLAGCLGVAGSYLEGYRLEQSQVSSDAVVVAGGPPLNVPAGPASAPGFAPPAGFEEMTVPRGVPPAVPAPAAPHAVRFLNDAGGGQPVTWSPCRPIHYVTRPDFAPPRGSALVAEAIALVGAATGLTFIDDGATTEAPTETRPAYQPERYGDRWAPVLIAWADEAEVPGLAGDVAGEAGPVWVTTPSGDRTYLSGVVHLDVEMASWPDTLVRTVILHELGHLVGLDHVEDSTQLMFESSVVERFGVGDQAGLATLGRGPCQPDI
jgi:hypothetical protein